MKRTFAFLALVLLVLVGCGGADGTPSAAAQPLLPPAAAETAEPPAAPVQAAETAVPVTLRIPAGTALRVRLAQPVDTERNRAGDRFQATLASPLVVNGRTALPRGTRFSGRVTTSQPSGRLKGRGALGLTLDSFQLNGRTYRVATSSTVRTTGDHKKRNAALIGGGSGAGAVLGGLAGGGKGALIGAGSGAAAGTAGAALTGKKHVQLPAETVLGFSLKAPVEVRAGTGLRPL